MLSVQFSLFVQTDDFIKGTVYVKWKESLRKDEAQVNLHHSGIVRLLQKIGADSVAKSFINTSKPRKEKDEFGRKYEDLSLIYNLYFPSSKNVWQVINQLEKSGLVEYAEPRYKVKPFFTPNDPMLGDLYHLGMIKAYEAWDITQGDTNITIGIVDAGIQFDHPDLIANIKYNYADPINGIDDDGNGYIDDWRGWNAAANSNNPTATLSPHGMFTSGISSAVVNNGVGVAGVGFKTKFLTVRIDNNQGWGFGYEGITYAASMNCTVINCSWGNTTFSQVNQAVINFATINKNCLIVAAAGNSNNELKVYPASYDNVISVGGTKANDEKWGNSTFNYAVDISAPADLLKSTFAFGGYDVSSGTSFAAPMVSAGAALLKTQFPAFSALQLGERLKVTSDTGIYNLSGNQSFVNKLGTGRLNLLKALTDPDKPSVYLQNVAYADNNDQILRPGDTITISGQWINYLATSTEALTVQINSLSPFIEVLTPQFTIGSIQTFELKPQTEPIKIKLLDGLAFNTTLALKLTFTDLNYKGVQFLEYQFNRDYADITTGFLTTTVTSKGAIGYNSNNANDGAGIKTTIDDRLLFYGGLMLGTSTTKVSNNAYGAVLPNYDNDFVRISAVEKVTVNDVTLMECSFNDSGAGANAIGVAVKQKTKASNLPQNQNFILFDYDVKNESGADIPLLASGLYMDWEVGTDPDQNMAQFDAAAKLAFAFNTLENNRFVGVKLLSDQIALGYSFNGNGTGGSVNYYDGFSKAEKFNTLSGALQRNQTVNGDVSSTLSFITQNLTQGDSVSFTYALITGSSLTELYEAGNQAMAYYLAEKQNFAFSSLPSGCENNQGKLSISSEINSNKTLYVYDAENNLIAQADSFQLYFELINLPAADYTIRIAFNDSVFVEEVVSVNSTPNVFIEVQNPVTEVDLSNPTVTYTAEATDNTEVYWYINGIEVGNTSTFEWTFTQPGEYSVLAEASNGECADSVEFTVSVIFTDTMSISQVDNQLVTLYPNPGNCVLNIKSEKSGIINVVVYDAIGNMIIHHEKNSDQQVVLDMSGLKNGVYVIKSQLNNSGIVYSRFIKN